MNSKVLGTFITVLGLLLVLGGLILILVVTPSLRVLSPDYDVTQTFDVEPQVLWNRDSEALETTAYTAESMPVMRLQRQLRVTDATDGSALVNKTDTLRQDDTTLYETVQHYVVDRATLLPVETFPLDWADSEGYWDREGVTVKWPAGVERRDYDAWSDEYRDVVERDFEDTLPHAGIQTVSFSAESDVDPIADEQVAWLELPGAVERAVLIDLLRRNEDYDLSEAAETRLLDTVEQAVQAVLGPQELIPLLHYYGFEGEYWVEPTTGTLIDMVKQEQRAIGLPDSVLDYVEATLDESDIPEDDDAYLQDDVLDDLLPVTVESLTYRMADETVEAATERAASRRDEITLYGRTLPILLVITGMAIAGAGGFIYARSSAS